MGFNDILLSCLKCNKNCTENRIISTTYFNNTLRYCVYNINSFFVISDIDLNTECNDYCHDEYSFHFSICTLNHEKDYKCLGDNSLPSFNISSYTSPAYPLPLSLPPSLPPSLPVYPSPSYFLPSYYPPSFSPPLPLHPFNSPSYILKFTLSPSPPMYSSIIVIVEDSAITICSCVILCLLFLYAVTKWVRHKKNKPDPSIEMETLRI